MARPIKQTPTLHGADARRFHEQINNPPKASREEILRAQSVYRAVNARNGGLPC